MAIRAIRPRTAAKILFSVVVLKAFGILKNTEAKNYLIHI
jgi:hypothetical protein